MSDTPLNHQRVLILVGTDYEDLELQYPKYRLIEAGADVTVAGPEAHRTYAGKYAYPQQADEAIEGLHASNYDLLVIPGGWMPDKLRRDPHVLELVKAFADAGKPIGSICHGPQIDISAGIVQGVAYTSSPGIKDDLINAGANWSDAEVVVDEPHRRVSSRRPDDLPAFCGALIQMAR
jgi:protease I